MSDESKFKYQWVKIVVTGFGVGLSPKMPGTMGTLLAIPLWYLLLHLGDSFYVLFTLVLTVLAIVLSDMYEKRTKSHDPGHVVIDEVVGFLITMTLLPYSLTSLLLGFALFRLLDIWKPWPISYLNDKVKGGFGVVVDDVAAGLAANIILQIYFSYQA